MKNKKGAVLNAYKFVTKKLTPWTLEGGSKTRPKKYSKQISSDVTIFVYGKWRSIYVRLQLIQREIIERVTGLNGNNK